LPAGSGNLPLARRRQARAPGKAAEIGDPAPPRPDPSGPPPASAV